MASAVLPLPCNMKQSSQPSHGPGCGHCLIVYFIGGRQDPTRRPSYPEPGPPAFEPCVAGSHSWARIGLSALALEVDRCSC